MIMISMGLCKKDVTLLLMHWSYVVLAPTHWWYIIVADTDADADVDVAAAGDGDCDCDSDIVIMTLLLQVYSIAPITKRPRRTRQQFSAFSTAIKWFSSPQYWWLWMLQVTGVSLRNKCRTADPDQQNWGRSGNLSSFAIYKFGEKLCYLILKTVLEGILMA